MSFSACWTALVRVPTEPLRSIPSSATVVGSTAARIGQVADDLHDLADILPPALANAASIAAMLLTTEALVVEQKEEDDDAGHGHGHSHGPGGHTH